MNQDVENQLGGYEPAKPAPTYTTEADIEAMASAIASLYTNKPKGWRPTPTDSAKVALAASPVHAELARVKAENERLREALRKVQSKAKLEQGCIQELDSHIRSYATSKMHDIYKIAEQALQTEGE